MDNDLVASCDALSLTRTVKVELPAAVGVPVIAPFGSRDNPAGRLPEVTFHVYGGVPPLAVSVVQYATATMPSGRLVVVLDRVAGATMIDNDLVTSCEPLSLTRTVNVELPTAAGVPVIAPFEASDNPGGKLPEVMLQVYGGVPPLAPNIAEYAAFTEPSGNAVVETVRGAGSTRIDSSLVSVSLPSDNRTEKE
jgi:hypothetical protein